jgi:L-alanine-DL-glutamate epimerase-like enolase superfamily enzyme
MARLTIAGIEVREVAYEAQDVGPDPGAPYLQVYRPGTRSTRRVPVFRVFTATGPAGEYAGGSPLEAAGARSVADLLLGRDPLEREAIYDDTKRALRQHARLGIGPLDIALWDLAGKHYGAPVFELLGGFRRDLPCYASTYTGDHEGGLDSPEAYADFAVRCREMGYPGYKIHPVAEGDVELDRATVLAVRKAVGDRMALMLDPACAYNTFGETVRVGLACDEARFFWYEDPFKDGGISQFAHKKLRQLIRTPLLQGEHVRTLEPHVDFVVAEATDFLRGDPHYDGGITGVMKIAHAAEGFGVDMELHGAGPAQRHLMAAVRNSNFYELGLVHPKAPSTRPPIYADGYSDELDAVDARGRVRVPEGPGLGVAYDWDFIRRHTVERAVFGAVPD